MLLIAALVLCSGISESLAQPPTCPSRCHMVTGYDGYCLNDCGVYVCVSKHVPGDDWGSDDSTADELDYRCSECLDAEECMWLHIRNVNYCCDPEPVIDWVQINITRDTNSTEFKICNVLKNFGQNPWTQQFRLQHLNGSLGYLTLDSCYAWTGLGNVLHFKTIQPTPIGTEDYDINVLNHLQATICGVSKIEISIKYKFPHNGCNNFWTFNASSVTTDRCPEPEHNCMTGW